ncbi:MAG: riboflavin synthase [Halobacteriovoraceae bacterium]|nr:riboflavin synthase [Halobacteriovoraceae bacterium]MCB9095744.1 riboflavin synthase [Halobacteriovoraceae bacterium]
MFTGIIKELGTVKKITENKEGKEFQISCPQLVDNIEKDDSVATNGVCLTATALSPDSFTTQVVHVTLEKTSLGSLKEGSKVNLELSLTPTTKMGGHFVQGHVNTTGKVLEITPIGKNWVFKFELPKTIRKYVVKEGSIAIDGVSLTVADIDEQSFSISIIPHTLENTLFHTYQVGSIVNLEADILAKYLENFIVQRDQDSKIASLLKNF